MPTPVPTPIYRMVHIDNLDVLLRRQALHAPNQTPQDGLVYRTIHDVDVQAKRHARPITVGPGGTIHDYVPFYFGPRSPMLLQLHTGRVAGYSERQDPLIYLVSSVQAVVAAGCGHIFSDGHGLATFTQWYAAAADLEKVDWAAVNARQWNDTVQDMDRQRRKQAEFLVYQRCPWAAVSTIAVLNDSVLTRVQTIQATHPPALRRQVSIQPTWYY
jgi:hypothetical protein